MGGFSGRKILFICLIKSQNFYPLYPCKNEKISRHLPQNYLGSGTYHGFHAQALLLLSLPGHRYVRCEMMMNITLASHKSTGALFI